jgi:hypothetical protein
VLEVPSRKGGHSGIRIRATIAVVRVSKINFPISEMGPQAEIATALERSAAAVERKIVPAGY